MFIKYVLPTLLLLLLMISCGPSKKTAIITNSKALKTTSAPSKSTATDRIANNIIQYAKTFNGTRYKYGGTTKKGMDCSGLIYTSFKKENIVLPRTSRAMSTQGEWIPLRKAEKGDLVFFKTSKKKNVINHVGLIVEHGSSLKFIHASVSKGVVVSSLDEKYWNNCFAGVRRVL
ncbi:C40 family peptidase [Aquimarina sp. W85]|uniref:C40 family peptidase n=1 Tax=Aquimarina rhodophyticola TaxID=3342246 RepID=UPI00366DEF83